MAIDTNRMRDHLGDALVTPGLTILALLDEIDRLNAAAKPTPPQQEGKTVKVRVAVAVDKNEKWVASGYSGASDEMNMASCVDFVTTGEARYWLTATLPVPEKKEIEAEVISE